MEIFKLTPDIKKEQIPEIRHMLVSEELRRRIMIVFRADETVLSSDLLVPKPTATQIKSIRIATGLSQFDFSEKYDISYYSITAWEAEKRNPRTSRAIFFHELAKILKFQTSIVKYEN
jgi:DNA-binding transcriptional regulator YiaG